MTHKVKKKLCTSIIVLFDVVYSILRLDPALCSGLSHTGLIRADVFKSKHFGSHCIIATELKREQHFYNRVAWKLVYYKGPISWHDINDITGSFYVFVYMSVYKRLWLRLFAENSMIINNSASFVAMWLYSSTDSSTRDPLIPAFSPHPHAQHWRKQLINACESWIDRWHSCVTEERYYIRLWRGQLGEAHSSIKFIISQEIDRKKH